MEFARPGIIVAQLALEIRSSFQKFLGARHFARQVNGAAWQLKRCRVSPSDIRREAFPATAAMAEGRGCFHISSNVSVSFAKALWHIVTKVNAAARLRKSRLSVQHPCWRNFIALPSRQRLTPFQ